MTPFRCVEPDPINQARSRLESIQFFLQPCNADLAAQLTGKEHFTPDDVATAVEQVIESESDALMYQNDHYTVHVRRCEVGEHWPPMLHLSIRRNDRRPCRDWRHFQEIKNLLVGPENEGVELYPAESRLVDTANQYHLFVLEKPGKRFPFGYQERSVSETNFGNSAQRPFDTH